MDAHEGRIRGKYRQYFMRTGFPVPRRTLHNVQKRKLAELLLLNKRQAVDMNSLLQQRNLDGDDTSGGNRDDLNEGNVREDLNEGNVREDLNEGNARDDLNERNPGDGEWIEGNPGDEEWIEGNPGDEELIEGNPGDEEWNEGNPGDEEWNEGNPGDEEWIEENFDEESNGENFDEELNEEMSDEDDGNEGNSDGDDMNFETRFLKADGSFLFPGAQISTNEGILLVFAFLLRHKLSNQCADDLLNLISFFLPHGASFPNTSYKLNKELGFDYSCASNNYYCKFCGHFIGDSITGPCENCKKELNKKDSHNSGHFFVSFDLPRSISKALRIPEVAKDLEKSFEKRTNPNEELKDIMDGEMYKKMNLSKYDLTFCVNTDGIPCFNSSKYSIWPILLSFNELEYSHRRKHVVLVGLWSGSQKPIFDTFFAPFVEECQKLSSKGISWKMGNMIINSKVYFPMFVADAPARCQCQGLMQFNGNFSCPWCLIQGQNFSIPDKSNAHKWVFPPVKRKRIQKRSHETFIQHLHELNRLLPDKNQDNHYLGVKMASRLLLLDKFDIVNGFCFDYMHCVLLGIARSFLTSWLDSKNNKKDFFIGNRINEIDQKLLHVLVPFDAQRAVRSLTNRRFWKATEWRTWMLVSGIVLDGILPEIYTKHFQIFVNAITRLCSDSIPLNSLLEIEKHLFKFVKQTEELYSLEFCSFNVHLLLHAVDSVRSWGPLFGYSTFQFENHNGTLLNFFNGTQYVPSQICDKVQEFCAARTLQMSSFTNPAAAGFYFLLLENRKRYKTVESIGQIVFVGKETHHVLSHLEKDDLRALGETARQATRYEKIIVHGKIYNSYARTTTKRCNSIVSMNNKLFLIRFFVSVLVEGSKKAYVALSKLTSRRVENSDTIFKVSRISNNHRLKCIQAIDKSKYICIKNDGDLVAFVVKLPNLVELE